MHTPSSATKAQIAATKLQPLSVWATGVPALAGFEAVLQPGNDCREPVGSERTHAGFGNLRDNLGAKDLRDLLDVLCHHLAPRVGKVKGDFEIVVVDHKADRALQGCNPHSFQTRAKFMAGGVSVQNLRVQRRSFSEVLPGNLRTGDEAEAADLAPRKRESVESRKALIGSDLCPKIAIRPSMDLVVFLWIPMLSVRIPCGVSEVHSLRWTTLRSMGPTRAMRPDYSANSQARSRRRSRKPIFS